jgi:hypothetical protein
MDGTALLLDWRDLQYGYHFTSVRPSDLDREPLFTKVASRFSLFLTSLMLYM